MSIGAGIVERNQTTNAIEKKKKTFSRIWIKITDECAHVTAV